jgi:Cysteine-rich CPXCG
MTRRKAMELESLKGRIARLDADSIDRLYGLEPVYEPGAEHVASLAPEEFVAVRCPWCGERLETRVDMTADDAAYIEDCEVCCRPIEFGIERADGGALLAVAVRRLE